MGYVMIAMTGIIVFIISVVIVKYRQHEEKKYYDAAQQMVREEYLTASLRSFDEQEYISAVIPMIYLKLCGHKQKQGYVFDPEKEITIGRDKNNNSIWVPFSTVSMRHCTICLYEGNVYLRDDNSANGTIVKKGFHNYHVINNEYIELETKDKITVGEAVFRVTIFYFQTIKKLGER